MMISHYHFLKIHAQEVKCSTSLNEPLKTKARFLQRAFQTKCVLCLCEGKKWRHLAMMCSGTRSHQTPAEPQFYKCQTRFVSHVKNQVLTDLLWIRLQCIKNMK